MFNKDSNVIVSFSFVLNVKQNEHTLTKITIAIFTAGNVMFANNGENKTDVL